MSEAERYRACGYRASLVSAALFLLGGCNALPERPEVPVPSAGEAACLQLPAALASRAAVPDLVIDRSSWRPDNYELAIGPSGEKTRLPAHCELQGHYAEYLGEIGGTYRTGFRIRLPQAWNGRFFFQGGGGSNGFVGDAVGLVNGPGPGSNNAPSALSRGYAIFAQDSGHDNQRNNDPEYQGDLVFGFDPVARANYGHASLKPGYDLGLAIVERYYGKAADYKLFMGCSKGGQEGMAFAQRYPESFDGILAAAPGFSLPRAAIAQAWDTQAFAGILVARGEPVTVDNLRRALSPQDMAIVRESVLETCDSDDGVADGIIGAIGECTSARVVPALRSRQCNSAGESGCLAEPVVDALAKSMGGPKDGAGNALYAAFPWDAGIGEPGWLIWKTGLVGGPPSLNVVLGGGALAGVFSSPPTAIGVDPEARLAWQLAYDFDRDAERIYAVTPPYETSPWEDVGMRSADLSEFAGHGGKMIVPHGMSDPVFSANDTIDWFEEVDERSGGQARDFVRVFPVPGMNHCGGGPATAVFDGLTALEKWVVDGQPPRAIDAKAGADTPWPGRRRPLCPYPQRAMPETSDAPADAEFVCR
jgi:hypothetical protein